MPAINYFKIEQELQALLQADVTLEKMIITVEQEQLFGMSDAPWLGIYMVDRTSPNEQYLAANTKQKYRLNWSLWLFVYGLELEPAIRQCSQLTGLLEVALMNISTISSMVEFSWLEGGVLPTRMQKDGKDMTDSGLIVCSETRLVSEIIFTTN